MPIASRWNLRAENDCLFVDDTSARQGGVATQCPTGHDALYPSVANRGWQHLPHRG